MNKVILSGRLTKDLEIRYTSTGKAVAKIYIAVNRRFIKDKDKQTADFFTVIAWDKLAEICGNHLEKGQAVTVSGRLQTGSYEKDGVKHYTCDVVADEVEFGAKAHKKGDEKGEYKITPTEKELSDDVEIPF